MSGFGTFDEVKAELRCVGSLIEVRFWCDLGIKDLNLDQGLVWAIKSSRSGRYVHLQSCVHLQRSCQWQFSRQSRWSYAVAQAICTNRMHTLPMVPDSCYW